MRIGDGHPGRRRRCGWAADRRPPDRLTLERTPSPRLGA
jgi:hypothetical protein